MYVNHIIANKKDILCKEAEDVQILLLNNRKEKGGAI